MSKKNNDSPFFNDLRDRMRNNADKLKGSESEKNDAIQVDIKTKVEENNIVDTAIPNKQVRTIDKKKDKPAEEINIEPKVETKSKPKTKNKVNTKKRVKEKLVNKQEIRRTYYLKKKVVDQVNNMAKRTKNNKSYLVELALRHFLDNKNLIDSLNNDNKEDIDGFDSDVLLIPDRKNEKKVRRTYYLKEDIIETLDKIADSKKYDKSFIVERALKFLIDNAKVK